MAECSEIIAQKGVDEQIEAEMLQERKRSGGNAEQQRHCRRCGKAGHNTRTCQKDAETTVN
jgi:hypothetical protein